MDAKDGNHHFYKITLMISKRWSTTGDKWHDLTSFSHCVTFSEKQEVDDVIQQDLPEGTSLSIAIVSRSYNSRMIFSINQQVSDASYIKPAPEK